MKPTAYEALRQAVDEELVILEEEWDSIDDRVEEIRSRN